MITDRNRYGEMMTRSDGKPMPHLDEQFVERLIRIGRNGYGNGGQLESFNVTLVDGATDTATAHATADTTATDQDAAAGAQATCAGADARTSATGSGGGCGKW